MKLNVFDEVNSMSAEAVLGYVRLETANDGKSYVCPLCGNGKGGNPRHGHGDGIKPEIYHGRTTWHCYKCGAHMSNFDLAAATKGVDAERDKAGAARVVGELFGIVDNNNFSFSKGQSARSERRQPPSMKNSKEMSAMSEQQKTASEPEPRNFAKMYEYCRRNYDLQRFVESRGGTWRGLTFKTLSDAGCLIHEEYLVGKDQKAPVMIVPYDDSLYFWREIDGQGRGVAKDTTRKMYVANPLSMEFPNYMVEAELDALSMKQALGNFDIGVVACGSAGFVQKTVAELETKYSNVERKPSFIVSFDNDDAGKKHGQEMVMALHKAGYPATLLFLEDRMAGEHEYHKSDGTTYKEVVAKVDANDLLQRGEAVLAGRLIDGIERVEKILQEQTINIRTLKEQEQRAQETRSGIRERGIGEYFLNKFADDVALTAKYSERLTGFDNLDGKGKFERDGQRLIFMPGLYMLGALPGAGKTTFAWQLLEQLAERGETCYFCSYEMSEAEMFAKSLARAMFKRYPELSDRLNLSSANIRRGAGRDCSELQELILKYQQSQMNLRVLEVTGANVVTLLNHLKPKVDAVIKSGGNPPTIAIDYLQIIPPTLTNSKATAKEKIDDIMLRLKSFQRDTNSTLIVISAFNRESRAQNSAGLAAFRESSSIEYSADVALSLDIAKCLSEEERKKKMKNNPRPISLDLLKYRNGALSNIFFNYHAGNDYFEPCKEKDLND